MLREAVTVAGHGEVGGALAAACYVSCMARALLSTASQMPAAGIRKQSRQPVDKTPAVQLCSQIMPGHNAQTPNQVSGSLARPYCTRANKAIETASLVGICCAVAPPVQAGHVF